MSKWKQWTGSRTTACTLWVALCFGTTSAFYLSWLHRLILLAGGSAADWLSMGAGYLCQAAGLGLFARYLRRNPQANLRRSFFAVTALFALLSFPAILTESVPGVIIFGLLANLLCGIIAGAYLYGIAAQIETDRRGRVFGVGYALATVAVGLLALIGQGRLLHSAWFPLLYLPFCFLMVLAIWRKNLLEEDERNPEAEAGENPPASDASRTLPLPGPADSSSCKGLLALACGVVFLISAVKNLGFSFPSANIEAGLIPELSRLPYALGLTAAGIINDKNRRDGMICTITALILPFIMLGLTAEPVSSTICWGLDYLFFGFFSVFRVVLFLDLAEKTHRWELAPQGLLIGRLGDVAGTAAGILLAGQKILLIAITTAAFLPTAYLFFRLYRKLHEPRAVQQRSEQEVFEAFCLHHDLSSREREVLRMVLDNRANCEIAEALFITESTVKFHVRNLLQKVGCKNRSELQKKYTLTLYPQLENNISSMEHPSIA